MDAQAFFDMIKQQLQTLSAAPLDDLQPDSALLSTGLVDSLSIVELIGFIEERCNIQVDPMELSVDNFGSISAMFDYARRKAAEATA
jgi:acyl carrier protein